VLLDASEINRSVGRWAPKNIGNFRIFVVDHSVAAVKPSFAIHPNNEGIHFTIIPRGDRDANLLSFTLQKVETSRRTFHFFGVVGIPDNLISPRDIIRDGHVEKPF
jgi:hypothetical protein